MNFEYYLFVKDDIIVEVNNKQIKYSESLKPLVNSQAKVSLKYIPVMRSEELQTLGMSTTKSLVAESGRKVSQSELTDAKLKRAQNFYTSVRITPLFLKKKRIYNRIFRICSCCWFFFTAFTDKSDLFGRAG